MRLMPTRMKIVATVVLAASLSTCATAVADPAPPPSSGVSDGRTYTVSRTSSVDKTADGRVVHRPVERRRDCRVAAADRVDGQRP